MRHIDTHFQNKVQWKLVKLEHNFASILPFSIWRLPSRTGDMTLFCPDNEVQPR
jgi:hypothetical protein